MSKPKPNRRVSPHAHRAEEIRAKADAVSELRCELGMLWRGAQWEAHDKYCEWEAQFEGIRPVQPMPSPDPAPASTPNTPPPSPFVRRVPRPLVGAVLGVLVVFLGLLVWFVVKNSDPPTQLCEVKESDKGFSQVLTAEFQRNLLMVCIDDENQPVLAISSAHRTAEGDYPVVGLPVQGGRYDGVVIDAPSTHPADIVALVNGAELVAPLGPLETGEGPYVAVLYDLRSSEDKDFMLVQSGISLAWQDGEDGYVFQPQKNTPTQPSVQLAMLFVPTPTHTHIVQQVLNISPEQLATLPIKQRARVRQAIRRLSDITTSTQRETTDASSEELMDDWPRPAKVPEDWDGSLWCTTNGKNIEMCFATEPNCSEFTSNVGEGMCQQTEYTLGNTAQVLVECDGVAPLNEDGAPGKKSSNECTSFAASCRLYNYSDDRWVAIFIPSEYGRAYENIIEDNSDDLISLVFGASFSMNLLPEHERLKTKEVPIQHRKESILAIRPQQIIYQRAVIKRCKERAFDWPFKYHLSGIDGEGLREIDASSIRFSAVSKDTLGGREAVEFLRQKQLPNLSVLDRECRNNDAKRCHQAGRLFLSRCQWGRTNRSCDYALELFEKSCNISGGKNLDGCFMLGVMYERGISTPIDHKTAFGLFEAGCEEGHILSCFTLIRLYNMGHGTKKSRNKAKELRDHVCSEGNLESLCVMRPTSKLTKHNLYRLIEEGKIKHNDRIEKLNAQEIKALKQDGLSSLWAMCKKNLLLPCKYLGGYIVKGIGAWPRTGGLRRGDCDGSDPLTYPGAPEICDGKDNNCDGQIDEGGCPPLLEP